MIDLRAAPRSTSGSPRAVSRRFASAAEAAVAKYAPRLWEGVVAAYLRRLRAILAAIGPTLDRMVIAQAETRAAPDPGRDPAISHIEGLIRQISQTLKDPDLSSYVSGLSSDVVFDRGLLATDQRISTMVAEASRLIESGLFTYWQNLTAPPYTARRIYEAKAAGLSGQPLYNQLAKEFRTGFYSAERLVRTLYTGGSNRSTWEGLKASGFTGMRWVSSHDSRVRPGKNGNPKYDHRQMDGMIVPITGVFHSKTSGASLRYPGDVSQGAPGGEIYNCRCTIVGVMLEGGQKPERKATNVPLEPDPQPGVPGKEIEAWKAGILAAIQRLEKDRDEIDALQAKIVTLKKQSGSIKRPPRELPTSDPRWKAYFDKRGAISNEIHDLNRRQTEIYAHVRAGVHEAVKSPRGPATAKALAPKNRNNRERTDEAVKWIRETLGPGFVDEIGHGPKFNAPRDLRRAYFSEYDNTVNFNAHENVRTIVHEVGHWIEVKVGKAPKPGSTFQYTRPLLERTLAWRESRTQGESWGRLRDLTGNRGYGSDEVAKPDKFLDPYVGKSYGASATEVVSMGLEHLYADPVGFYRKDPGHFELMLELIALNRKGIP